MKKAFAVLLAIICLLTLMVSAVADGDKPWPGMKLSGSKASMRPKASSEDRYMAYFGPGTKYPDAGSYLPGKVTSLKVLFQEGDFYYVDMNYQTAGKRCLYFKCSAISNVDAKIKKLKSYPAHTTIPLVPVEGPGKEYEIVTQTTQSADWNWDTYWDYDEDYDEWYEVWYEWLDVKDNKYAVHLPENTKLDVFFETDDWVFAEFKCTLGTIRAWMPAAYVEAD